MNATRRWIVKSSVLFIGIFLGAALLTAAKPDGAAIYKQRCAMCHGADGKGFSAIKTPDMTNPEWQASVKDKDMVEVIKSGKKGTPMPPFGEKLKEEESKAVLTFIRSLDSGKKKKAPANGRPRSASSAGAVAGGAARTR